MEYYGLQMYDTLVCKDNDSLTKKELLPILERSFNLQKLNVEYREVKEIDIYVGGVFQFITDANSKEFCEEVADQMIMMFGISKEEAIARINSVWHGTKFLGSDLIYHEDDEYWAKGIYYGRDWWTEENKGKLEPRIARVDDRYYRSIPQTTFQDVRIGGIIYKKGYSMEPLVD